MKKLNVGVQGWRLNCLRVMAHASLHTEEHPITGSNIHMREKQRALFRNKHKSGSTPPCNHSQHKGNVIELIICFHILVRAGVTAGQGYSTPQLDMLVRQ
jgi:hypothetical protein